MVIKFKGQEFEKPEHLSVTSADALETSRASSRLEMVNQTLARFEDIGAMMRESYPERQDLRMKAESIRSELGDLLMGLRLEERERKLLRLKKAGVNIEEEHSG